MDSIDLVFVYQYNKNASFFAITNVELAKNNIFITGKNTGKKIYSVYEKLHFERKEDKITYSTDISAIKEGFIKTHHVDLNDKNINFNEIIERSFNYAFKCYCYDDLINEGEELILSEKDYKFDEKRLKEIKISYMQRVFNLIINYKLNNKPLTETELAIKALKPEINIQRKNTVKYLIEQIKKKVIGQDEAVSTIVPAIVLNQKLIEINNKDLTKTQKSNILIDGSTGVGKTLIVEELANLIDVPIVISGITNFSAVGYKGSNLNEIIYTLIAKADGNIEKAKNGIICFDEIDKLGDTSMEMRKAVAQELLTWINGTTISIPKDGNDIPFDTSNITFVCLGAFGKMREERNNTRSIGFDTLDIVQNNDFNTDDYIKFGMQRELMGRFNTLITLNDLVKEDYKNILLFSEISPLKSFIDLANIYDVDVTFDESFLDKIVELSIKDNIGARALQRQMNKIRSKYIISIMDKEISSINLTSDEFDDTYKNNSKLKKDLTLNC